MNAAAATAISSFCFRLFRFNDILSLLWSVPAVASKGNAASEHTFQTDVADTTPGTCCSEEKSQRCLSAAALQPSKTSTGGSRQRITEDAHHSTDGMHPPSLV